MQRTVEAVSFDFYNTLVYHRSGRGRGRELVDYLTDQGFVPAPWQHQVLYDVFTDEERLEELLRDNLLHREVHADDVARVFVDLALADKTTAAIVNVDGGNIASALR